MHLFPILKCRFYYYLGTVRLTGQKMTSIEEIVCYLHPQVEGTWHTIKGTRAEEQAEDAGRNHGQDPLLWLLPEEQARQSKQI